MSWAAVTGRGAAGGEGVCKSNKAPDSGDADDRRSRGGEGADKYDASGGGEGGEGADAVGAGRCAGGWDSVSSWNHSWNTKPATPPGNKDSKSSWANVVGGQPKGSWANVVGIKNGEEAGQSGSKQDTPPWPQVPYANVLSLCRMSCIHACTCLVMHLIGTN